MNDSLFDLSGKVALVTGTSRGLGQYFARALAKAGADLAITSRDKSSLAAFADEIHALGRKTFSADLDVRDHSSIQSAIAAVEYHFGKIDILVNNAGCNIRKPALDVTWDDWNTILETNLRGSFFRSDRRRRIPFRQDRHPRQQCRLQHSQTCVRRYLGRLEHHSRDESPRFILPIGSPPSNTISARSTSSSTMPAATFANLR